MTTAEPTSADALMLRSLYWRDIATFFRCPVEREPEQHAEEGSGAEQGDADHAGLPQAEEGQAGPRPAQVTKRDVESGQESGEENDETNGVSM